MNSSIVARSGLADSIELLVTQYSLITGFPFWTKSCWAASWDRYLSVASDSARAKSSCSDLGSYVSIWATILGPCVASWARVSSLAWSAEYTTKKLTAAPATQRITALDTATALQRRMWGGVVSGSRRRSSVRANMSAKVGR